MELDRDRDNEKDVSNLELSKEGVAVITPTPKSSESIRVAEGEPSLEGPEDQSNMWDKQAEKEGAVGEKNLGKEQDGWPEWKEVRQSKRLRDNGTSHFKMGEQIQDRMATGLEHEGIIPENQNSFAVLTNIHIASLASKMGIHSDSLSFDKIDVLRNLENARMKLNNNTSGTNESVSNLEDEDLPSEEHNILDWGTDDSEEEP